MTKPSEGSKECGYCRRRPPLKYCKRHTNITTITYKKYHSESDIQAHVKAEIRKTLLRIKEQATTWTTTESDSPEEYDWEAVGLDVIDNEIKSLEER